VVSDEAVERLSSSAKADTDGGIVETSRRGAVREGTIEAPKEAASVFRPGFRVFEASILHLEFVESVMCPVRCIQRPNICFLKNATMLKS
jgi:hypothetical protein